MGGGRTGARHIWLPTVLATTAAVGITLVVLLPNPVPGAFHAPELHVAVETANVLVGLLVALLVYGRYRVDRRLHQLLLMDALTVLAAANVALATSAGLGESATVDALRWASVGGRLVGSMLLFGSAVTGLDVRVSPRLALALQTGLSVLLAAGALAAAVGGLPPPVRAVLGDTDTGSPSLETESAVVLAQVAGVLLCAGAAVLFTRRAVAVRDQLTRWLAAGTILATFARVHFLIYPSLLSDVVYTGDVLRAGFYGCLLVGALREIESYWRLRARAAVLDERRRIARDLHDGMAQELTYILAQSRRAAGPPNQGQTLARIEDASSRALDEARRAIETLNQEDRHPFAEELRRTADDLAERYDLAITVEVAGSAGGAEPAMSDGMGEPGPEAAEQLLRIVGEAVRNAARHGHARGVRIALRTDRMVEPVPHRLTVSDDGAGFDPSAPPPPRGGGGYGLVSMRERAKALGGAITVDSAPGHGTTVTVTW